MVQVFRTLCCFSSKPFLKQLLHLMFPPYPSAENLRYEVFSHPSWVLKHFFLEGFKVFLHSVNEIQVITHTKKKIMMVKTCFFNVLFQLL